LTASNWNLHVEFVGGWITRLFLTQRDFLSDAGCAGGFNKNLFLIDLIRTDLDEVPISGE
jgi:hypothetical protein